MQEGKGSSANGEVSILTRGPRCFSETGGEEKKASVMTGKGKRTMTDWGAAGD